MDTKRERTEEEIAAAWERAPHFKNEDPAKKRLIDGRVILRDKYGAPRNDVGAWVMDEADQPQHPDYLLHRIRRAQAERASQDEMELAIARRRRNEAKAQAAGLSNAEIFERLDRLEEAVEELQRNTDQ